MRGAAALPNRVGAGASFHGGGLATKETTSPHLLLPQTKAFGEIFAQFPGLKKGDELLVDWTPTAGSQAYLNGKKVGESLPDQAFFNAIMRIWIGNKPVDTSLKPKLLLGAERPAPAPETN